MKTMIPKRTRKALFTFACLLSGLVLQAQEAATDQPEAPTQPSLIQTKLAETEHTPWENTTITLLNREDQTTTEITAKSANYRVGDDVFYRITAFKSASSESFWIGPEQDFYVELEKGISGGVFRLPGAIVWCESMVSKSTPASATLDSVISAFEEETDKKALGDAWRGRKPWKEK